MRRTVTSVLAAAVAIAASGCDDETEDCVEITTCCQVCYEGAACGDECLPEGEGCAVMSGCACDVEDVCVGGGVRGRGSLEYATCVGPQGACSTDCCMESNGHSHQHDAVVSCTIRGDGPDGYRVTFSAWDPDEDNGVQGTELSFSRSRGEFSVAASCEDLFVREAHNEYPAGSCSELDVRTEEPFGGGCHVELRLNEIDILEGRFTCQDLQLPAQELFLSTVGTGEVAAGTFQLYGCDIRL